MNETMSTKEKHQCFYLYIKANPDWDHERKYKYGYTKQPVRRLYDSQEEHSEFSNFIALLKMEIT